MTASSMEHNFQYLRLHILLKNPVLGYRAQGPTINSLISQSIAQQKSACLTCRRIWVRSHKRKKMLIWNSVRQYPSNQDLEDQGFQDSHTHIVDVRPTQEACHIVKKNRKRKRKQKKKTEWENSLILSRKSPDFQNNTNTSLLFIPSLCHSIPFLRNQLGQGI